jgi:hypothetical protein
MTLSAAQRAARYRQQADRFRRMAETEVNDHLRRNLLDLAKQYGDLAKELEPRQPNGA